MSGGREFWRGGVGELKPYLQSITGAGLDVRAGQQHVERIYDLVFISLFNTISVAFKGTERERETGSGGSGRERDSLTSVSVRPAR